MKENIFTLVFCCCFLLLISCSNEKETSASETGGSRIEPIKEYELPGSQTFSETSTNQTSNEVTIETPEQKEQRAKERSEHLIKSFQDKSDAMRAKSTFKRQEGDF